jgi:hypothetical protein
MARPYPLPLLDVKSTPHPSLHGDLFGNFREASSVLQRSGATLLRVTNGHSIWSLDGRRVVVPCHPNAWKGVRGRIHSRVILRVLRESRHP